MTTWPTLAVMAVPLLVLPFAAPAQDAGVAEIRSMGRCVDCVLTGGDYSGARLSGLNLSDAQLTDMVFDAASMAIAVFDGARLENVRFDGANLRGASFVGARLVNVSFDAANLHGAIFEDAVFEGTDLGTALLCKTQMPDDRMASTGCDAD